MAVTGTHAGVASVHSPARGWACTLARLSGLQRSRWGICTPGLAGGGRGLGTRARAQGAGGERLRSLPRSPPLEKVRGTLNPL